MLSGQMEFMFLEGLSTNSDGCVASIAERLSVALLRPLGHIPGSRANDCPLDETLPRPTSGLWSGAKHVVIGANLTQPEQARWYGPGTPVSQWRRPAWFARNAVMRAAV